MDFTSMASVGGDAAGFVASLLRGTVLREVSVEGWDVLVDMSICVLWRISYLVWEMTLLPRFAHEQPGLQKVSAASRHISAPQCVRLHVKLDIQRFSKYDLNIDESISITE